MQQLSTAIEDVSPYTHAYCYMAQVEQEENNRPKEQGHPAKPVTMFFKSGQDQQRYKTPLEDDIAAVFVGEDGAPPGFTDNDIALHSPGQPCEQVCWMTTIHPSICVWQNSCHVPPHGAHW